MNKKASIIIPLYKEAKNFEQCIKSIVSQSLKELEIICINNNQNDEADKILQKFQKNDKRINIINKMEEGLGSAINAGLNAANAEYIAIINPNDYIDKKMHENLYKLAKKCDADIVKSPYSSLYQEEKKPEKINWQKRCKIPAWFFRINECPSFLAFHPSIFTSLYKRTFLNNNSIRFVEAKNNGFIDAPFHIETMLLAQKIIYTDTAYYYRRQKTLSSNGEKSFIFDRAEEISQILLKQKTRDKNVFANIYKRQLKLIATALDISKENSCVEIKDVSYEAQRRIEIIAKNMDEDIIKNNPYIDEFEKRFFSMLTNIKTKNTV